jgi:iron complex outermembrane recepter protein
MTNRRFVRAAELALLGAGAVGLAAPASAQEGQPDQELEEITVTGTRIQNPNIIAASPITTIDMDEISLKQTPNIERIFRDMPITIPGDGENVNNGTAGQATIDLRGLGPERMLVLIDGKRLAPYDINGVVTTSIIPVNMLERVDVVTGGASAVYGSDALSGAVNFILRDDFEGFELEMGYSDFDSGAEVEGGGEESYYIQGLFGAGFDDDRGHIVFGGGRTERGAVRLAEREFGLFGVSSTTGAGLAERPARPEDNCSGNTEFSTAASTGVGSTTAIPGTLDLRSGNSFQFRDDMTLAPGTCALFNFNPYNYYQRPQERWLATTIASYDYNENVELYARGSFASNTSNFLIAPSGTFGTAFTIPVMNPFFNDAARNLIIDDLSTFAAQHVQNQVDEIARVNGLANPGQEDLDALAAAEATLAADPNGFVQAGIQDFNGNSVFDANDAFTSTARRRTPELNPRSGIFDTDYLQYVIGARGGLPGPLDGWNYDVSYQYGESDFVETRDGFTNLTNLAAAINTVDPDECIDLNGNVTPPPCTPINVFGPEGSITDAQRDSGYFIALASDIRKATQTVWHASVDGTLDELRIPMAGDGLSLAFGVEFSELTASSSPDECLKLAPASCQGGAGGNRLPVSGAYDSNEYFVEAILPIVQDRSGFESLSLETGYRSADYSIQGSTDSWKAGIGWEIVPGFRFRVMEQKAVRVPNIGELFRPVTTALDNATLDPCSAGNPNPPAPGSELFNRCVATGMVPSQVGTAPDIVAGQINVFTGTNPNALPSPEEARTTTFGFVWQAELPGLQATTLSLDYYDIEISDYIDTPSGQESLDLCYIQGDPLYCNGIVRIGGAFGETGTGVPAFFTNFERFAAEGIDFTLSSSGYGLGRFGELGVDITAHKYLTNEFKTTPISAVVDCKGRYGTSCDPVPEFRATTRVSWFRENVDASLLWRHIGSMDAQTGEAGTLFPAFRSIDSFNYFDLSVGFNYRDFGRISLLVSNIADEMPPIIGDTTGTTAFNSGSTFPSLFDTLGRTYGVNLKFTF